MISSHRMILGAGRCLPVVALLAWVTGCREITPLKPLALSRAEAESRLATIKKQLPARPVASRLCDEWENLNFQIRKARYVRAAYAPSDEVDEMLSAAVLEAQRCLGFVTGSNVLKVVLGEREEAYFSDNDASFQPFVRFLPKAALKEKKLPMVVFLHGYSPRLDIANWSYLPKTLVECAEDEGAILLGPFGRSNTDYQGVGEQDVLNAIKEMQERYRVDEDRIILVGYSMGGMGAWTIGAHQPDFFAGLVVVSGRGDYYYWKKVNRNDLPLYKRALVDAEFGFSLLPNLTRTPIMSFHATQDSLIPIEESRHMVAALKDAHAPVIHNEIEGDHWIAEEVFGRRDARKFLAQQRRPGPGRLRPVSDYSASPCGPIKRAFLSPFVFVCAEGPSDAEGFQRFQTAAREWYRFAKAFPRVAHERRLRPAELSRYNLFVFGEPEQSPMIRKILEGSPVSISEKHFAVGKRTFERHGNGLYVVRRNPWNPDKLAVVQCGLLWGEGLPENHKYDFLPDYIVYSEPRDEDGSNTALCAGFFDAQWNMDPARMYAPGAANGEQRR